MNLMQTNVLNINKELLPICLKLDDINFLKCDYEVYKFERNFEKSIQNNIKINKFLNISEIYT